MFNELPVVVGAASMIMGWCSMAEPTIMGATGQSIVLDPSFPNTLEFSLDVMLHMSLQSALLTYMTFQELREPTVVVIDMGSLESKESAWTDEDEKSFRNHSSN
jgi:hypothetical protein